MSHVLILNIELRTLKRICLLLTVTLSFAGVSAAAAYRTSLHSPKFFVFHCCCWKGLVVFFISLSIKGYIFVSSTYKGDSFNLIRFIQTSFSFFCLFLFHCERQQFFLYTWSAMPSFILSPMMILGVVLTLVSESGWFHSFILCHNCNEWNRQCPFFLISYSLIFRSPYPPLC